MIKTWKPILADINEEMKAISRVLEDTPFNSEFGHQINIAKTRICSVEARLQLLIEQMKGEEGAARAMLEEMRAECRADMHQSFLLLQNLMVQRKEKSRANYLHLQALKDKALQEETAGEETINEEEGGQR